MKVQEVISEGLLSTIFSKPISALAKAAKKMPGTKPPTDAELAFAKDISTIKKSYGIFVENSSEFFENLKTIGLISPFYTYYRNMSAAEANLKSGKFDQARYDEEQRIQMGFVITSLVSGLIGNKILKSVTELAKVVKIIPGIGGVAADIIGGVSNVAQAALVPVLSSTEGRTVIAELFTVGVIEGAGDLTNKTIEKLKELISSAQSPEKNPGITTPTTTTNKIAEPQQVSANKPTSAEKPVQQTTPTSAEKPVQQTTQPEPKPKTQPGKDEYVSDRFVRGPNGELRLANYDYNN